MDDQQGFDRLMADMQAFPDIAAILKVFWTPEKVREFEAMLAAAFAEWEEREERTRGDTAP